MGVVFRPRDILRGREHMVRKALRDLSPGRAEQVEQILRRWRGEESEQEIVKLLGEERAKKFLHDIGII
jgi:uncharacterized protein HemY